MDVSTENTTGSGAKVEALRLVVVSAGEEEGDDTPICVSSSLWAKDEGYYRMRIHRQYCDRNGRFHAADLTRWLLLALAAVITTAMALSQTAPTSHAVHSGPDHAAPVPDRLPDSYLIYSVLMPGQVFSDMDSGQNQPWAISDTTVNEDDINPKLAPEATLQAPSDNVRAFQEAVNDYNARKKEHLVLKRHFKLSRPYVLLSPTDTEQFKASRTLNTSSSTQSKYGNYIGITFFSEAYFNSTQTAALVYILDWCGNLCSQSEWVYLEKRNGAWVRRSGKAPTQR